jgi:hypothetical protein
MKQTSPNIKPSNGCRSQKRGFAETNQILCSTKGFAEPLNMKWKLRAINLKKEAIPMLWLYAIYLFGTKWISIDTGIGATVCTFNDTKKGVLFWISLTEKQKN